MGRCHVRCRKCEARRVFRKHPDHMNRHPTCSCGAKSWRADGWMNRRRTSPYRGGMGCNCTGYWFPHRRGSLYCWYRPDGTDRLPGDPDFVSRDDYS